MIVQITLFKNELPLLKELLPIWKKYTDGFVFLDDESTDGSYEYLMSHKEEYNILEVLKNKTNEEELKVETNIRQRLFDCAIKYSNKIICLDADEYLDGSMSKLELEKLLEENKNSTFFLQWIQYTSENTIRVDGPWRNNLKDRIGCYTSSVKFETRQSHSTHLPICERQLKIDQSQLFIAHLQWVNKQFVAIKQYYWKVFDYVNNKKFNIKTATVSDYDSSINDFNWEEEYVEIPMKISTYVFETMVPKDNYRLKIICENTKKYNIPNLGSWNYDFLSLMEKEIEIPNKFKISVITAIGDISTYGKFIDRYFDNIKNQHFFNRTEHIIVYKEWSDEFEKMKNYNNIKFIKEDKSLGIYYAWNLGIQNASAEYVTNWNIDDIRHPINTKVKYDLLSMNIDYDVCYNQYAPTIDENDTFDNIDMSKKQISKFPDNYELYAKQACLIGPDPMWKKSLHIKCGYFDYENFPTIGDWDMWIRFSLNGAKFKLIDEVLCVYLDHENTASKNLIKQNKHNIQMSKIQQKYK